MEIEEAVKSEWVDLIQTYKDLFKFMSSKDWEKMSEDFEIIMSDLTTKIIDKRGDCEIKHSLHVVQWAKNDIYSDFVKQLEEFPLAVYFKEEIIKEIDAIISQIIYRVADETGVSLDTPQFSDTDLIRFELSTYARIKSWLPKIVDTLDPKKKGTKNTINPYDENYSNQVEWESEWDKA